MSSSSELASPGWRAPTSSIAVSRCSIPATEGGRLGARATVVATGADAAAALLPGLHTPAWKGVSTVYHVAAESPLREPTLVVDAERSPVNNTVVVTEAAPSYSLDGRALIATSMVHGPAGAPPVSEAELLGRLADLYCPRGGSDRG